MSSPRPQGRPGPGSLGNTPGSPTRSVGTPGAVAAAAATTATAAALAAPLEQVLPPNFASVAVAALHVLNNAALLKLDAFQVRR